jgi:hypothetical protein
MKHITQWMGAWMLTLAMASSCALLLVPSAQAQRRASSRTVTQTAYQQGYPAGYRDGYYTGKDDFSKRLNRDFRQDDRYESADRAYQSRYGERADYQDGYRLGYELGYVDGYYGRTYRSSLPPNALTLRQTTLRATASNTGGQVFIPDGLQMRLRLDSTISTKTNREGDRFKAQVVSPPEYEGATVEGRIAKLDRSGRLTGKTELLLEFDTITLRNGRRGAFRADVQEILASDSVKAIDEEGNIETSSRSKDTAIRGGGGAALGAIIGAIAGGGKGAAIGALIGAGVGAGSVYIQGKKDLILEPGAEMVVRTAAPQGVRARN